MWIRSRGVFAVAVAAVALMVAPSPADACSCAPPDHSRDIRRHNVAFRGVAQSARRVGNDIEVTFTVHARWNGVSSSTREVRVLRQRGRTICPLPSFRLGVRYNVYANRAASGAIRVGACNPSSEA